MSVSRVATIKASKPDSSLPCLMPKAEVKLSSLPQLELPQVRLPSSAARETERRFRFLLVE